MGGAIPGSIRFLFRHGQAMGVVCRGIGTCQRGVLSVSALWTTGKVVKTLIPMGDAEGGGGGLLVTMVIPDIIVRKTVSLRSLPGGWVVEITASPGCCRRRPVGGAFSTRRAP